MPEKIPSPQFSEIPELQKLFVQAREYIIQDGITKRIGLYRKIEALANKLKAEKEIGSIKSVIAKYYLDHGKYKTALKHIYDALPIVKKHGPITRVSNLYNWLAGVYMFTGDYSNALDFFQREIDFNIQSGLEKHCFTAYNSIGGIYFQLDDLDTAEHFFNKASEIAIKDPEFVDVKLSWSHLNTGIIILRVRQERYTEAEKLCHETLKRITEIKDKRIIPNIYHTLALIHNDLKNYKAGLDFAFEAEKYVSKDDFINLFSIARTKAINYRGLQEYGLSASEFRKCFKYMEYFSTYLNIKAGMLHAAEEVFIKINSKKDIALVKRIMTRTELDYETLRGKLELRASQLIEFTNKYAPEIIQPQKDFLTIHAVAIGKVTIPIDKIYACQTQQDIIGKNVTRVYVKDDENIYRVPSPLKCLYALINSPSSFVWINKNAFINKNHLSDSTEIKIKGIATIDGHQFEVSRRKKSQLARIE